jgi:hypothetical protein
MVIREKRVDIQFMIRISSLDLFGDIDFNGFINLSDQLVISTTRHYIILPLIIGINIVRRQIRNGARKTGETYIYRIQFLFLSRFSLEPSLLTGFDHISRLDISARIHV